MQHTKSEWSYRILRRLTGWHWQVLHFGIPVANGSAEDMVEARAKAMQWAGRQAHQKSPHRVSLVLRRPDKVRWRDV